MLAARLLLMLIGKLSFGASADSGKCDPAGAMLGAAAVSTSSDWSLGATSGRCGRGVGAAAPFNWPAAGTVSAVFDAVAAVDAAGLGASAAAGACAVGACADGVVAAAASAVADGEWEECASGCMGAAAGPGVTAVLLLLLCWPPALLSW